jgi:hypothetical protein
MDGLPEDKLLVFYDDCFKGLSLAQAKAVLVEIKSGRSHIFEATLAMIESCMPGYSNIFIEDVERAVALRERSAGITPVEPDNTEESVEP